MILVLLGLLVLVVAAVVAVAGIVTNTGAAHELTNAFSVFGHQVTGSTGTLFLFGIIVGSAAMLGLGLLLTGARRASRRGAAARHGLRDSRRETAAATEGRDDLVGQRDDLTAQRDDLAEQRDVLARQRDELVRSRSGVHEQTAGTRVAPMPRDGDGTPPQDGRPQPDGTGGPHLLPGTAPPPAEETVPAAASRHKNGDQS